MRNLIAVVCAVLVVACAAPSFASGVVVRRGLLGRQRVVVRQPGQVVVGGGAQNIIVGRPQAIIAQPQAVVVPQSVVVPHTFVPQQSLIIVR